MGSGRRADVRVGGCALVRRRRPPPSGPGGVRAAAGAGEGGHKCQGARRSTRGHTLYIVTLALLPCDEAPELSVLTVTCGHIRGDYAREGLPVFRALLVYLEVLWAKSQVAHATSLLSSVYTYTLHCTEAWVIVMDLGLRYVPPWRIRGTRAPRFVTGP